MQVHMYTSPLHALLILFYFLQMNFTVYTLNKYLATNIYNLDHNTH